MNDPLITPTTTVSTISRVLPEIVGTLPPARVVEPIFTLSIPNQKPFPSVPTPPGLADRP